MTPRIATRRVAWIGLCLLAAACAQPSPPPAAVPAARPTGAINLTAPEPAPIPSVEARHVSPTGGPGFTHRESLLPDAGAQGNAGLDGTLPDLARPRLPRR